MRAPITTVETSPRARAVMLGAALTVVVLSLAYAGVRGHTAWNLQRIEKASLDWEASEAKRGAFRYGEVRLPLRGDMCTSYVFDNMTGIYTEQRQMPCEPPTPPRRTTVGDQGFARMLGVANAFKK